MPEELLYYAYGCRPWPQVLRCDTDAGDGRAVQATDHHEGQEAEEVEALAEEESPDQREADRAASLVRMTETHLHLVAD